MGHIFSRIFPLIYETIGNPDELDLSNDELMVAYRKMLSGFSRFLNGIFTIAFVENRDPETFNILVSGFKDFLPRIVQSLPNDEREKIIQIIKKDIEPNVKDSSKSVYDEIMNIFKQANSKILLTDAQ